MAKRKGKKPKIRILIGETTALGPGKVSLLEAIAETGSISAAARAMNMSYRRAWLLVDVMNRSFIGELVSTERGGSGGGGARVTPLGQDVLNRYQIMEKKAQASVDSDVAGFAKLLMKED